MQPNPPYPKFPEQNADGIDLSLINRNLLLTPTERVRRNYKATQDLLHVRELATKGRLRGNALMDEPQSGTNFEKLFAVLQEHDVDYILIGGYAEFLHGRSRITLDIDICYSRRQENLERLANALVPYHPRFRGAPAEVPFRLDVPTLRQGLNFTLETDLGDLVLIGDVEPLGEFEHWQVERNESGSAIWM